MPSSEATIRHPYFQIDLPGAPGQLVVRMNRPMSETSAIAHLEFLLSEADYRASAYLFDGTALIHSIEPIR